MAKAKAGRAKSRRTAGPKRATSAAKSRKSKKSPKARAKTSAKARRQPARKAVTRRRSAPRSARATTKRPRPAVREVKRAARAVKKVAKSVVKRVARKAPARKPPVKRAPSVVAARSAKAPVAPRVRPAVAPVAKPAAARAPRTRTPPTPAHGRLPALDRERRRLPEADVVPSPPSSLDLNRAPSAARSGQAEIAEHLADHTETGPELTGGDVDASWESAYSTGDEAPGGDNPTPDQDVVDDIGRSLGLVYEDTEELKGADKITERDKHRWELDPASAEDFEER